MILTRLRWLVRKTDFVELPMGAFSIFKTSLYWRDATIAVLFFITLFLIGLHLLDTTRSFWEQETDLHAREIAQIQSVTLQRNITRSLSAARILGAHVKSRNGDVSDFNFFAREIYRSLGGITNLQLAPDGVVRQIYPLAGHEKAIGHDLLVDDARRKEAHLALKKEALTLAGPFELVQGGVAIVGRQPVMLPGNKQPNPDKHVITGSPGYYFWGFASALIYLDDILKMSDLPNLAEKGFNYQLWRHHPDSNQPETFSGSPADSTDHLWTQQIDLPNSTWFLAINPTGHVLSSQALASLFALNTLLSLLAAYWLYSVLTKPKHLQRKVLDQTAEIFEINRQLKNDSLELKKFSNAVWQSGNAIIIANRQGIIEYVNPRFTKVTGYTAAQSIGQNPRILKSGTTNPLEYQELWGRIQSGDSWHGELHNKRENGELYWSFMTISPIRNDEDEITHFVSVSEDITDKKIAQLHVQKLAYHDPLTGLANRRYFMHHLDLMIKQAKRNQSLSGLLYLDIDKFKLVNDRLGHAAGDKLLVLTKNRLEDCLRDTDLAARMGGDEFAVILGDVRSVQNAQQVAEKILNKFQDVVRIEGAEIQVTVSIGITLFDSDRLTSSQLVRQADTALYQAKDEGRNNFRFYREKDLTEATAL